jgi:hypothetical protein
MIGLLQRLTRESNGLLGFSWIFPAIERREIMDGRFLILPSRTPAEIPK